MHKVIVNSKALLSILNQLGESIDDIKSVALMDGYLHIQSLHKNVKLNCEIYPKYDSMLYVQKSETWVNAKKLLKEVEEQPIVIQLNNNRATFIFEY